MKARSRMLFALACGVCSLWTAHNAAIGAPAPVVTVKTDRPDALYKCGEKATFQVSVKRDNQPVTAGSVLVALTLDGNRPVAKEELALGENAATVSGSLAEPGFLRCTVTWQDAAQSVTGLGGAGFEPERIKAAATMPEDFNAFWDAGRAELTAIPLDVQLTPLPAQSNAQQDSFKISFANVDNTRIYGFLSVPKGKQPPFPAYVTVPSAGIGKPREPLGSLAAGGRLALTVGVHPHDLGLPDEEYKKLGVGELGGYTSKGAPDREKYYFRRAILGVDRAITWLASRPDYDGKHLVIEGSSQGGAFALILAGLNPHITAAAANVPALCDHAGYLAGRQPGWPNLVWRMPADKQQEFLKMSAYFDAVNFARRIKCPAIVSVGFIDTTCSPSSVYAAFNEIRSPKRIFHGPLVGHGLPEEFGKFSPGWEAGQLGLGKAIPPTKE